MKAVMKDLFATFGILYLVVLLFSGFSYSQTKQKKIENELKPKVSVDVIKLEENDTVVFKGDVDTYSIDKLILEIEHKIKESQIELKTINLVMNTNGGQVFQGKRFIEYSKKWPIQIRTITLLAESTGFHMVQGLGERLITKNGQLLAHQAIFFVRSFRVPIIEDSDLGKRIQGIKELDEQNAKRMNISYKEFVKRISGRDYILVGNQAVKANAADRVVEIECADSIINSGNCPINL